MEEADGLGPGGCTEVLTVLDHLVCLVDVEENFVVQMDLLMVIVLGYLNHLQMDLLILMVLLVSIQVFVVVVVLMVGVFFLLLMSFLPLKMNSLAFSK